MPKTIRRRFKPRKTTRRQPKIHHINAGKKSQMVRTFLDMLNTVKLYHWKTRSYAQHKATDELYGRLNEHVDKFVEVLLGKDESRISTMEKRMVSCDSQNQADFKKRIHAFREYLIDLHTCLDPVQDTDLLNIRDEIVGDINQFLYLMTFDK